MTGCLDLTLKHINKFRLLQSISSSIYMFKLKKKQTHTRPMCQIYSKLTKGQWCLVLLLLTLNIFDTLFCCYYCRIWLNKCWWSLRNYVSDNKIVFSCCEKCIVQWATEICWTVCFHSYSLNVRLPKDKFSWQHFKMISRTLQHHYRFTSYSP